MEYEGLTLSALCIPAALPRSLQQFFQSLSANRSTQQKIEAFEIAIAYCALGHATNLRNH
jgi:hypothetical protein